MSTEDHLPGAFAVKDCSLVALATGVKAQNSRELRDGVLRVPLSCLYYHFWGGSLRPRFDDPQFHNDFAIWSHYALHDDTLAERLAIVDPTRFDSLEDLRQEVLEIIEDRLEEIERPAWVRSDQQFHFIRSQIVVLDTRAVIEKPEDLGAVVPNMSVGSVFYHYIDARRRNPLTVDDFRAWLQGFGDTYEPLCRRLASVDPYFQTLRELRAQLASVFHHYFNGLEP